MLGRGTRLCPDLLGAGKNKQFFYIFDFCQNLEFFSQDPPVSNGATIASLGARLFAARVALVAQLDRPGAEPVAQRGELGECLRAQVAGMNLDNFIVRPKRRLVEKYASPEGWAALGEEEVHELSSEMAELPTAREPGDTPEAKLFDLLMLQLQLTLLHGDAQFERHQREVRSIAGLLEEQAAIPSIAKQMALIQEIQTDLFWVDASLTSLEEVRRKLRGLVGLIEKRKRATVFTDFDDEMGEGSVVDLPGFSAGVNAEKVREKVLVFRRRHEDDPAIHKLRWNEPLPAEDLEALEEIFAGEGSTPEEMEAARGEGGLGLFVRSLVGLDREAAKRAMSGFAAGRVLTAISLSSRS